MTDFGFIIEDENYIPPFWNNVQGAGIEWDIINDIVGFNGDIYTVVGAFYDPIGQVKKSIDNGLSWTTVLDTIYGKALCLNTDTDLLYLSASGLGGPLTEGIYTTIDGIIWNKIAPSSVPYPFYYNQFDGFFYSYGSFPYNPSRSLDAVSWVDMPSPTATYVNNYEEFNGQLYVCGENAGNAVVHRLSGETWEMVLNLDHLTYDLDALCLKTFNGYLYAGISVFVGYFPYVYYRGEIHRTANGISWDLVASFDNGEPSPTESSHAEVKSMNFLDNKLYINSGSDIFETENGMDYLDTDQDIEGDVVRSLNYDNYIYFTSFSWPVK